MLPLFWLSPFSCRPGVRWTNDRHHDCADIGFTNRHLLLQGRAGKDWWKKEEIKNSTRHFAYLWVSTWEHHEFLDHYIYIIGIPWYTILSPTAMVICARLWPQAPPITSRWGLLDPQKVEAFLNLAVCHSKYVFNVPLCSSIFPKFSVPIS